MLMARSSTCFVSSFGLESVAVAAVAGTSPWGEMVSGALDMLEIISGEKIFQIRNLFTAIFLVILVILVFGVVQERLVELNKERT